MLFHHNSLFCSMVTVPVTFRDAAANFSAKNSAVGAGAARRSIPVTACTA
jgi:hypothetical protein